MVQLTNDSRGAPVRRFGHVGEGRNAPATGIDRSTLAVLVKRLVTAGYVRRRRSKTDARAYVVRLTDNGRKVLDANRGEAARTDEHLFAPIAASHRARFLPRPPRARNLSPA